MTSSFLQLNPTHRCWCCDAALESDVVFCPHCGFQVRSMDPEPTEVRTFDIVMSVIMAVIALGVTLPLNLSLIEFVQLVGFRQDIIERMVFIGLWHGYVLGLPLIIIARRWYLRVRQGQLHHAWVWHDYWYLQARILWPVWCVLVAVGLTQLIALGW